MIEGQQALYAGFSNVTYDGEPFDLGHGVKLRAAYAHLFSAPMMAFAKAEPGKAHPAPWHATNGGGFSYDIEVEISVLKTNKFPGALAPEEVIWLIAALLRLAEYAYLVVPVLSNQAFDDTATSSQMPSLQPFETEPRLLTADDANLGTITLSNLEWVKSVWPRTAELIKKSSSFNTALRAADACTVRGRPASALLMVWGALEELFAPSRAELRFRVSAHIAAYLEPAGSKRLAMFKSVASLYNERSKAAHSAKDAEVGHLIQSFVILRNALVRMIEDGVVPKQTDFEQLLFCGDEN